MKLPARSQILRGRHVAVAGAGLAGLTAAWALQRRGAEVSVFEARHRIGGRVCTLHGLAGTAHGELGADIIEEDDRQALALITEELGLSMRRVLPGGFHYYSGRSTGGWSITAGKEMFDELRALLAAEIDALARAGAAPWSAIARALGSESALHWARRSKHPRQAVAAVESLRGFFAAEPREFSLLMVVQQLSEEGDPASMKLFRIAGGNSRLAEALAQTLRKPVELAARVVRVERGAAVIDRRGRRSRVGCDAVVVAVPATTAREIEFSPALPPLQYKAIATLRYGRATKALVTFDRRFWRRRGRAFATRLPIGAVWEAGARGDKGTLAFLAGGDASASLASLVAGGTERDWRRELRWLGIGDAKVLDAASITWEDDPYVRGSYAHQSPDYDPALAPLLSAPAGRVAFAGEHTSTESQGYMEGAVMSGLRAADDIELVLTNG